MSEETLKCIRKNIVVFGNTGFTDEKAIAQIFGIPIAVCGDIPFGDFEVVG